MPGHPTILVVGGETNRLTHFLRLPATRGSLALSSVSAFALATDLVVSEAQGEVGKNRLLVPYAFYNESTETAVGLAWAQTGYIQPQLSFVVNGFYSANGSNQLYMQMANAQMPFLPRLFVNAWMFTADWGEIDSYQNGNPNFPNEIAGSNDSDEDNFVQAVRYRRLLSS